ncbi:hypothetical protein ABD94_07790 [Bacillus aryabhattai]|uniref:Uncharacterized protein n=1 Tax=Priestia megaterium (strain ATCC 12872 / QMB1551) TaxID=545693 RepID=D5E4A0_PRIM1|nr:hypothetical protein BMQ_pBM70083 [Priestia megaterium QM B1551]MBG9930866.1 hypothetical protein [Priestia aryabhattai]
MDIIKIILLGILLFVITIFALIIFLKNLNMLAKLYTNSTQAYHNASHRKEVRNILLIKFTLINGGTILTLIIMYFIITIYVFQ